MARIAWRCGTGRFVQASRVAVPAWNAKGNQAEDSRALDGIADLPAPVRSVGGGQHHGGCGAVPAARPGLRALSRILRRNGQRVLRVHDAPRRYARGRRPASRARARHGTDRGAGTSRATARRVAGRGVAGPTPTRPNAPAWRASAQRTRCRTLDVRARCSRCSLVRWFSSRRTEPGSLVPQCRPAVEGQGGAAAVSCPA